jgi:hypothetical protein
MVIGTDEKFPDPDKAKSWCGRWIDHDVIVADPKQVTCKSCLKNYAAALKRFREIIKDRIGV